VLCLITTLKVRIAREIRPRVPRHLQPEELASVCRYVEGRCPDHLFVTVPAPWCWPMRPELPDRTGGAQRGGMARILIMDDDELIIKMLRMALENRGYDVIAATNGREGVRLYGTTPVDLVISDILMPEMDGIEALKALRQRNPELKLIAVSGGGKRLKMDLLKVARILGATATFEKPYNIQELLATVSRLLSPGASTPVHAG